MPAEQAPDVGAPEPAIFSSSQILLCGRVWTAFVCAPGPDVVAELPPELVASLEPPVEPGRYTLCPSGEFVELDPGLEGGFLAAGGSAFAGSKLQDARLKDLGELCPVPIDGFLGGVSAPGSGSSHDEAKALFGAVVGRACAADGRSTIAIGYQDFEGGATPHVVAVGGYIRKAYDLGSALTGNSTDVALAAFEWTFRAVLEIGSNDQESQRGHGLARSGEPKSECNGSRNCEKGYDEQASLAAIRKANVDEWKKKREQEEAAEAKAAAEGDDVEPPVLEGGEEEGDVDPSPPPPQSGVDGEDKCAEAKAWAQMMQEFCDASGWQWHECKIWDELARGCLVDSRQVLVNPNNDTSLACFNENPDEGLFASATTAACEKKWGIMYPSPEGEPKCTPATKSTPPQLKELLASGKICQRVWSEACAGGFVPDIGVGHGGGPAVGGSGQPPPI